MHSSSARFGIFVTVLVILTSLFAPGTSSATDATDVQTGQDATCIQTSADKFKCMASQGGSGFTQPFDSRLPRFSPLDLTATSNTGESRLLEFGDSGFSDTSCVLYRGSVQCWTRGKQAAVWPGLGEGVTDFSRYYEGRGDQLRWCAVKNGGLICALRRNGTPTTHLPEGSGVTRVSVMGSWATALVNGQMACTRIDLPTPQLGNCGAPLALTNPIDPLTMLTDYCVASSSVIYCLEESDDAFGWVEKWSSPGTVSDLATDLNLHQCAVIAASAKCWGQRWGNSRGISTWDPSLKASSSPRTVSGLESGVTKIAIRGHSGCAVRFGTLKCWPASGSPSSMKGPKDYFCAYNRYASKKHPDGYYTPGSYRIGSAGVRFSCYFTGKGSMRASAFVSVSRTPGSEPKVFNLSGLVKWKVGKRIVRRSFSLRMPRRGINALRTHKSLNHTLQLDFSPSPYENWADPRIRVRP